MSTAAATEPIRVSHTDEDNQVFVMPKTASGFKQKVIWYTAVNNIECSPSRATKIALRLARRMDRMNTVEDFYEALRILGMTTDTTARDAVRNIERNAR